MSEFHDPDFENLLGRSGGPMPDVNIAYERVQGRVRQVKRRRAVVASSAACVVLFGAAVFAGARTDGPNGVAPAGPGSDVSNSTDDTRGSSLAPDSTITSTTLVTDSSVPTQSTVVGGGSVTPTTQPGSSQPGSSQPGNTTPGNTTPGNTTPGATNPPSSSTPATNPPTTNPPATNPPAPVDRTFSSGGCSITVRLQNGSLSLLSSNPAGGYQAEVKKNGGTRVEVRFDNGNDTIDIRVDLVNGQMVQH